MIKKLIILAGILVVAAISLPGCVQHGGGKGTPPDHLPQYTNAQHVLDATSFEYFYEDGSGLTFALYDGKVKYEWIVGPRKGNKAADIPYQSRRIGDDLYMVNWHEKDKPDFVSLIVDLKKNTLYSSAILRYGTGNEMIHFKEATLKNVQRTEK
jgi:hypothetical protein